LNVLKDPWILGGIALLILFFCTYITALSWADLTYVLPATALSYVLMALLAKVFLHEQVTLAHWLGIGLITAGVGFVATGPSITHPDHGEFGGEDRKPQLDGVALCRNSRSDG
jgi:drug/metabolite transporter (DMT)-like permease